MPQVIDNTTDFQQPKVVGLLKDHKISYRMIGRAAGIHQDIVINALDQEKFGKVGYANLTRIRRRIVALLRAVGVKVDTRTLWAEYDNRLDEVA